MNTRREILALLSGAVLTSAAELAKPDTWITIATPGRNKNQRQYTPVALRAMREGCVGAKVMKGNIWPDEGSLALLLGMVRSARALADGTVQVQINWFSGKRPKTVGYITPTGNGQIEADSVISYRLSFLCFSPDSAFEGATKL